MSTYSDAALSYLDAGWTGVLPVPVETKFPPPTGYTGADGQDTDRDTITTWSQSHGDRSIALRMPVGVIGIDVDHYDKEKTLPDGSTAVVQKRGGDTLAEYESKWGKLPDTWRSSARGLPSGIRFYRVPEGLKFATVLGDAIEIIQRHHRYAVVAPSSHPSTGGTYEWSHPEYSLDLVPTIAELPMLPAGWVAGLSEHVNQSRAVVSSSAEATALLGAIELDPRPMCSLMEIACNRAVAQLNASASGSRHDTAMGRIMRIVGLAAEGHTGGAVALERSKDSWDTITAGEGRDYEWESLVAGAGSHAAGAIGSSTPRPLDPCEGGSGLGIDVISSPTGKHNTTLIVEGLDDARMCSEYAPENTAVVGIAGRESWRKDGVPVAELRIVAGTGVVIVASPDTSYDLASYTSAVELSEACMGKGASAAAFSKPPGVAGARVSNYLMSLDEAERAPALGYMLSAVTNKPASTKPKAPKKSYGADDPSDDLPPTNDTYLGTTWADEHLDEFRVVSTDKTWMIYRDGRWSVDGAELAVGHSLMEFVSEQGQAISAAAIRARTSDLEKFEQLTRAYDAIMSSRKRQALQSTAMVYNPVHVRRDQLDQHPRKFCVANGVLDLETLKVTPHDPNLLLTTGSEVPFVPNQDCPKFDRFLDEVLPDAEVRAFVLRVFAMAMYGEVLEQVLPVFIGDGRNGKGVLIKIMLAVFGSHAHSINAKALLKRKFDAHDQEIAQLAGKRLAVAEETGQGAEWDVARVNEWTGGGRLNGRFMQGNSFNFEPTHTLLMVTNHRPNVGQGESAFWARYKEVPFTQSFEGREDPLLARTILEEELPGVLNRLIVAGRDYRAAGLQEPAAVTVATLDARVDADYLARYVAEHVAVTGDHDLDRIVNAELSDSLSKWWSQNVHGEASPGPRTFGKLMRQALEIPADAKNPRKIGKGVDSKLTWTGIRWLNGGSSDTVIPPLVSVGPEKPLAADLSEANDKQGEAKLVDPKEWSAASGGGSAAKSAALVDHEADITAGDALRSTRSAESASKSEGLSPTQEIQHENHPEPRSSGIDTHTFPELVGTNTDLRQTRQRGRPEGTLVFDLETASADELHDHPEPRKFVRIAGYTDGNSVADTESVDTIIDLVASSQWVVGTNLIHFDLPALQRISPDKIDVLELTRENRVLDTMVTESVLNPVKMDERSGAVGRAAKHFSLASSCERYGIEGKTDNAKALAKEYDGFDKIPVDVLRPYVHGDVSATARLKDKLIEMMAQAPRSLQRYVFREHRVHAIASQMSMSGFLANRPLLQERFDIGEARKLELKDQLCAKYDIPTTTVSGKPAKSVVATKEGKEAIVAAFVSLDVNPDDIPRTEKGAPSFGGDNVVALAKLYESHHNAEKIESLCEIIGDSWGVRAVYKTAITYLKRDGRVHPQVATFQASGRWSVTKPGLTVFGKRGLSRDGQPRVNERAVFRAGEGNLLMAIDLSQVDARAVAVHSQDHAYMDLFLPGRDSHTEIAKRVWNDEGRRQDAKIIGHGWNYNMGLPSMVNKQGVDRQVAEQFYAEMAAAFPRLVEWKAEIAEKASQPGAYLDNGFGRLMLPDTPRAYTQGPALMGQGCARDLMMQCLLNVDDTDPRVIKMLRAQIHDEAIFEFPKDEAPELRKLVEKCFNFEWAPPGLSRPIEIMAEGGPFGEAWHQCY